MRSSKPATPQRIRHYSLGMHCNECQVLDPAEPRHLLSALIAGAALHCSSCGARHDIWRQMVNDLTFGVFGFRYAAVGANIVLAELRLHRDQPSVLDFQAFGIPEAAKIEEIALTPQGGGDGWLHPVFLKDPDIGQPASERPVVYPLPVGSGADENSINLLIVWTSPRAVGDPPQEALLAGVRAAHKNDHLGAIISANVAMELALGAAMSSWLAGHSIGRERSKQFLDSEATYGSQLAVLLPIAAAAVGLAPMPERAKAALGRLRRLRNDVAHSGIQAATIGDADMAECLAGAAVGVVYCNALLEELD